MGATDWNYFVPYQKDAEQALQELRSEVFQNGLYEKAYQAKATRPTFKTMDAAEGVVGSAKSIESVLNKYLQDLQDLGYQTKPTQQSPDSTPVQPQNIEELLAQCGSSGTHSILDIQHVGPSAGFGVITRLQDTDLLRLFGTDRPTHDMVEEKLEMDELEDLHERFEGVYLVVYEDDKPVEICFVGHSGD